MVVSLDAIVVIDFVNDFVSGKLGDPKFVKAVHATRDLITKSGKFIVFVQDAHHPEDPELEIWGPHSMDGTYGAETVQELKGMAQVIKKRTYDAFFNTPLEAVLMENKAKKVLFCGVVTDICIIHSVSSSFFRGFKPIIAEECTDTYSPTSKKRALNYMAKNYGAKIISVRDIEGK